MSSEDPRELARRLAEQAKQRLAPAPAPVEPLADDDGDAFVMDEPPEPEIVIAQSAPAAERVGSGPGRTMSALEALNAARARERTGAGAAPPPRTPVSPAPMPAPAGTPAAPPSASASAAGPAAVVAEAFPGSVIRSTQPVTNPDVFRAVWRAHRNRAIHSRDIALLSTASVLLDAVDRIPRGLLLACAVETGADRYAVWVDAQRGALLAVAAPPEIYLIS